MTCEISDVDNRQPAGLALRVAMRVLSVAAVACVVPSMLQAQSFKVADKTVQAHGFASQAFLLSNENNYLTVPTDGGSFQFTDFGVNVSSQLTKKLRAGAQFFAANVGQLGQWHPQVDWAFADYRFTQAVGVRGGKVKTMLGLYNDTQDISFLNTWALLPQSIYALDLRSSTIAHLGADVYGTLSTKHAGAVSYTLYAGKRPQDMQGGYIYGLSQFSTVGCDEACGGAWTMSSYGGNQEGGDLRWSTPGGFLVGASFLNQQIVGLGTSLRGTPHREESKKDQTMQAFGQFVHGNTRVDAEYRRSIRNQFTIESNSQVDADGRSGYVAGAQRLSKYVEVGGYWSQYIPHWNRDHAAVDNHITDRVATGRLDLFHNINIKVEGHFIDGYGATDSIHGFYIQANRNGFKRKTNLLIIRTSFAF
jgi:hypothetical protein